MQEPRSSRLLPWVIACTVLAAYLLTAHGYVDIEDTEISLQAAQNLIDHGSLAIPDAGNGHLIIREQFYVVPTDGGAWYPIYPLLQILLAVPGVVLGRFASGLAASRPDEVVRLFATLPNTLCGALLAAIVFGIGRRLGQRERIAAVSALLAALGTMTWSACQGTLVDPELAVFTAASVLCLLRARPPVGPAGRVLPWLVLAGLLHGCGVSLRPSALLLLLPSAWYLRRLGLGALIAFLLPVALTCAGLTWLDVAVFGRPFEAGFVGWGRQHPPVWTSSYTNGLYGLLISDGCGLFTLSPLLLLALLAWPGLRARLPDAAGLLLGHLAVLVLFFAAFDGWYGGWCWGPRYLLPAVPLWAALAGEWLARRGLWRRLLAVLLAGASVGIQGLSVAVPHRIHMVVRATSDAHIYMFFYFARFSPVVTHARILAHKLRGEPEVYSLRELFGEKNDAPVDVIAGQTPQVDRYNAGFEHLVPVRLFAKGHWLAGSAALGAGLLVFAGGVWWILRRTASGPTRDDGDVGADRALADDPAPQEPGQARQDAQ